MTQVRFLWRSGSLLLAALAACHSQPAEPAPPLASFELAVAPPGARGARAAGTDAAPPPPTEQELSDPGSEGPPEADEVDAGSVSDGGPKTDATPGIAL